MGRRGEDVAGDGFALRPRRHTVEEQIAKVIAERTGLDPAMALKAANAVMDFIKENPEKLSGLLGDDSPLGDAAEKITKLFGREERRGDSSPTAAPMRCGRVPARHRPGSRSPGAWRHRKACCST